MKRKYKIVGGLALIALFGGSKLLDSKPRYERMFRFQDTNQNVLYDTQLEIVYEIIKGERGERIYRIKRVIRGQLAQEKTGEQIKKEIHSDIKFILE